MQKRGAKKSQPYVDWLFKFVPPDARFFELKNLARGLNTLEGTAEGKDRAWSEWFDREGEFREDVRKWTMAHGKKIRQAWEAAREIITECLKRPALEPLPARAVRRFNSLAREEPVLYFVRSREETLGSGGIFTGGRKGFQVPRTEKNMWSGHNWTGEFGVLTSGSPRSDVVLLLREFFVCSYRNRLKQCPVCRKWFVDASRNETSLRCGVKCTNRWWNRTRRREANHNHVKP